MKTVVSSIFLVLLLVAPSHALVLNVPDQYESITAAISAAQELDTIIVESGVYNEHLDFGGKDIVLSSRFIIDSSLTSITGTVLDGSLKKRSDSGTVVLFQQGESAQAVLTGFTIQGGFGTLIGDNYVGGGILCRNNSNPTISSNIIRNNNALNGGGCAFIDSDPDFFCNMIINNNALIGGGISLDNSRAVINRCIIAFNTATEAAAAIYILLSDNPIITNSVFYKNSAAQIGGIDCFFSFPQIAYNDFFGNTGGNFSDCILGLGDTTLYENYNKIPSDLYQNIFRDPKFVDPSTSNYKILGSSPLVDAGSEASLRFPWDGSKIDIGCHEFVYLVGDANNDATVNISDAFFLVNYIFFEGPLVPPVFRGDFNCDRLANITDVIRIVLYIFQDGAAQCQ